MFDKIGDFPLHPLVLHAPVVGIPLATLLAFLFAFPKTRNWARWPLGIVVIGATAATFVTRQSGIAFEKDLGITGGNPVGALIARHFQLGTQLLYIMIVFTVIALVNVFVVSRGTRDAAGGGTGQSAILRVGLPVLLVVVAAVAFVWVVRVGDLGARAVWNPTAPPLIPF
jgi:hypothetical protein